VKTAGAAAFAALSQRTLSPGRRNFGSFMKQATPAGDPEPKAGNCCVFCSYGSVKCPPMQAQKSCCSGRVADNKKLLGAVTMYLD